MKKIVADFDLIKAIEFKRDVFNRPLTDFTYNRTKKRQVENVEDWLDGVTFGFEEALSLVIDYLSPHPKEKEEVEG